MDGSSVGRWESSARSGSGTSSGSEVQDVRNQLTGPGVRQIAGRNVFCESLFAFALSAGSPSGTRTSGASDGTGVIDHIGPQKSAIGGRLTIPSKDEIQPVLLSISLILEAVDSLFPLSGLASAADCDAPYQKRRLGWHCHGPARSGIISDHHA